MRIGILGLGLMRGNLGTIFVLLAMKSSSATRSNDKLDRLARVTLKAIHAPAWRHHE